MPSYKHTQISYLMLIITAGTTALFAWLQLTARDEAPSADSGTNFAVSAIMVFVLFMLVSFLTLTVAVDEQFLSIRFGWGIFRKKFVLSEIVSVKSVRNPWYYGWGIKLWLWPKTSIFSISGFDAVELIMNNGKIYRIGTDEPEMLVANIKFGN